MTRYSGEIQKFINDIDDNFDNIVDQMEMEPFKEIISTYENRLDVLKSYSI